MNTDFIGVSTENGMAWVRRDEVSAIVPTGSFCCELRLRCSDKPIKTTLTVDEVISFFAER